MAAARKITFAIPDDADRSRCRSCGEPIAWIVTDNGKKMPVELATNESHFARCPEAVKWRKPEPPKLPGIE